MLILQGLWATKRLSNWAELYKRENGKSLAFSEFIEKLASDTCVLFHPPRSGVCRGNMPLENVTFEPLTSLFYQVKSFLAKGSHEFENSPWVLATRMPYGSTD